jgi:tetratricopeptide (TPR) repeat protein
VWELPRDDRPVADLVRLAEVVAGRRIDDTGSLVPLGGESLGKAARQQYPQDFAVPTQDGCAWHLRQAEDCEQAGQRPAALWHLDRLKKYAEAIRRGGDSADAIRLKKDYAQALFNLGIALGEKGQTDEAIAAYEEAIRFNKDHAEAHNNLGSALLNKGQWDKAIAEYRAAISVMKDFAWPHHNLANALLNKGQWDKAIDEFREALSLMKFPAAHLGLGNALRAKGLLDQAIDEYRKAIALKRDYADAHYILGVALGHKGQLDDAITAFREAIALKRDYAEAHCDLGVALLDKGQFQQALEELRLGHQLGSRDPRWPHPSAQWVREAERWVELDAKLPKVLKKEIEPADAAEHLQLALLCHQPFKQLYCAAVRLYTEAFRLEPQRADGRRPAYRYYAARAAALAGCGQGKDADKLDDKECGSLRRQSLTWLRADLAARRKQFEGDEAKLQPVVRQTMQHWLGDTAFAGVRDSKALANLPEAERQDWQKLWSDVKELLRRAEGKSPGPEK